MSGVNKGLINKGQAMKSPPQQGSILQRAQLSTQVNSDNGHNKYEAKRGSTESGGNTNNVRSGDARNELRRIIPNQESNRGNLKGINSTEQYGVVCSVKPAFGFIQPMIGEEQAYFAQRDFYPNMKIGDKVGYSLRSSSKGPQADNVRFLPPHLEKVVTFAKGTVVRNPDRHRSGVGLIELDLTSLKPDGSASLLGAVREVLYRPNDVVESSIPKHHRLDKGDTVEFSISRIHDSSMMFACNVKLMQLKRDRLIAVQIQRMLDAGAVRELGVISMLRKGEFGFIKAQDRKDEIYFRVEDIVEEEDEEGKVIESKRIKEGSEVDFFATVECVKGKMSDRAIHIKGVKKGTVRFEVSMAQQVEAIVVEENVNYPNELPGKVRLAVPVDVSSVTGVRGERIDSVELWQRCLPDELQCKVGDKLILDVQYYRPEKLYFARSVIVSSFRKIGRELGYVVSKKDQGFGFIHSTVRNMDIYFKLSQVVGLKGEMVNDTAIEKEQYMSFEVTVDEGSSGGRLRAQRVQREDNETAKARIADAAKHVVLKDVQGVVVRNAVRKDSPGIIRVHSSFVTQAREAKYVNRDLVAALTEFRDCVDLTKVTILGLSLSMLKSYYQTIDQHFTGISYETSLTSESDASAGKTLTLKKLNEVDYAKWLETNTNKTPLKTTTLADKDQSGIMTVQFFREDYESLDFGPLANDLKVVFDLCGEENKGKKVARSIRLTDEPVADAPDKMLGVMEVVVEKEKNEPFGFIRCIPSDEKLFWHCSETFLPYGQDLRTGSDVSFTIRRRGGMRCAVDIDVLGPAANSRVEVLPDMCYGVITENGEVVLTDVSRCPLLHSKFVDLKLLHGVTTSERDPKNSTSEKASWEKVPRSKLSAENETEDGASPAPLVEKDIVLELSGELSSSPVPILETATEEVSELEYPAKYFSSLPRLPVPVSTTTGEKCDSYVPKAGDLVTCKAIVNWAVQRSPISVSNLSLTAASPAVKRKGRINKLKFRVKTPDLSLTSGLSEEALSSYAMTTIEFVEIMVEKTKEQRAEELGSFKSAASMNSDTEYNGMYYYCDLREVRLCGENSRDLVQNGDDVDFWSVSGAGNVAFNVVLCPKISTKEIQFGTKRGPTVNAELKDLKVKTGAVNVVTMAQGPPNDAAKGFELGWREEPLKISGLVLSELPWASMLSHLAAVRS